MSAHRSPMVLLALVLTASAGMGFCVDVAVAARCNNAFPHQLNCSWHGCQQSERSRQQKFLASSIGHLFIAQHPTPCHRSGMHLIAHAHALTVCCTAFSCTLHLLSLSCCILPLHGIGTHTARHPHCTYGTVSSALPGVACLGLGAVCSLVSSLVSLVLFCLPCLFVNPFLPPAPQSTQQYLHSQLSCCPQSHARHQPYRRQVAAG